MNTRRLGSLHYAKALAAVSFALFVSAQGAWPQASRTINVTVAAPADGPTETLTHLLADQIRQAFNQTRGPTLVIENGAMANGVVGAEAVSRAPADGNTLLLTVNAFLINPYLRHVNYDPLNSFEPVCYLANSPELVVVNSASQYHVLGDLLNAARSKPGALSMASFGPAGALQIAVEMLKRAAGVNITYVPYGSEVPVINALLSDRETSGFTSYIGSVDYLKSGRLRALATGSRSRVEALPDVPTIAELGYQDFEAQARLWLFAPAKTPKETVAQLAALFTAAMKAPEVRAKLVAQGLYPVAMCGADFAAYLRNQYEQYSRIIGASNLGVR